MIKDKTTLSRIINESEFCEEFIPCDSILEGLSFKIEVIDINRSVDEITERLYLKYQKLIKSTDFSYQWDCEIVSRLELIEDSVSILEKEISRIVSRKLMKVKSL